MIILTFKTALYMAIEHSISVTGQTQCYLCVVVWRFNIPKYGFVSDSEQDKQNPDYKVIYWDTIIYSIFHARSCMTETLFLRPMTPI